MNVIKDPHFNNPAEFNNNCQGLELFNDFTYTASYNPELALKPVEAPDFSIPCFNGNYTSFLEKPHLKKSSLKGVETSHLKKNKKAIWK